MTQPNFAMPARNRRVLLTSRPVGIPQAAHFSLDEADLDPVGEGQFRVRNLFLSVDPAQRGWANEGTNYADPVPLDSTIGINGLTAWIALTKLGQPTAEETVLVTTAAGSVGSVVGQLARDAGCRVLGLTGGENKVARCVDRFGYHAAANYKSGDVGQIVGELAPDGIDVLFDNVGGPILDIALRSMNVGGRVVQCGTASIANWDPAPIGLRNEREVLMRRLRWGGFVIFDHKDDFPDALRALEGLIETGKLTYDEDITTGFAAAPGAIARLYAGENAGKQLFYVGDA